MSHAENCLVHADHECGYCTCGYAEEQEMASELTRARKRIAELEAIAEPARNLASFDLGQMPHSAIFYVGQLRDALKEAGYKLSWPTKTGDAR